MYFEMSDDWEENFFKQLKNKDEEQGECILMIMKT